MSLPTAAHDQVVSLTQAELSILNQVDTVMEKVRLSGNPRIGLQHAYALRRDGYMRGLASAKLLYHLSEEWASFNTDEHFEDAVLQDVGYATDTTRKYVRLWGAIFANPEVEERVKKALLGKPIGGLLLISSAAKEGDLEPEDWDRIIQAHDKNAIREIVKEKRGARTSSKSALYLVMERDGTLRCRRGNRPYKEYGRLIVGSDDIDIQQAVERTLRAPGIAER